MARDGSGRFKSRAEVNYNPPSEDQLAEAAALLLEWLSSLDPNWGTKIQVAMEERHWTKLQVVGQLVAYTLEQGAHLVVPPNPAFEPGFVAAGGTNACPVCGKDYTLRYPAQPYCSNACAQFSRQPVQLELDKANET